MKNFNDFINEDLLDFTVIVIKLDFSRLNAITIIFKGRDKVKYITFTQKHSQWLVDGIIQVAELHVLCNKLFDLHVNRRYEEFFQINYKFDKRTLQKIIEYSHNSDLEVKDFDSLKSVDPLFGDSRFSSDKDIFYKN